MKPVDVNYIPPPAYSEQEFEQKTSRATELSLELAKWETSKFDLDEDGFPRYDPAMFEDVPRTEKGKNQPTFTKFRSSSINKRPLPNPNSISSSSYAGPSNLRQTAPLHISKKSITKAEEAARDVVVVSSPQALNQRTTIAQEVAPPYTIAVSDSSPLSTANQTREDDTHMNVRSVTPNSQSISSRSEGEPQYPTRLPALTSTRQSYANQWINTPRIDPSDISTPSLTVSGVQPTSNRMIENLEDNPPYTEVDLMDPILDPQSIPSPSTERTTEENPPYEPNHRYGGQPVENEEENWATPRQDFRSTTVSNGPFELPRRVEPEVPERLTQGRGQLNLNRSIPSNLPINIRPQDAVAHDLPVLSPQHLSLPPAPRRLPHMNNNDRPRSQSTISSTTTSRHTPSAPRVAFNPNVAYGRTTTGGSFPSFYPKVQQTPFQAHMFYNSAVSSQMSAQIMMADQPLQQTPQRPELWTGTSFSTPMANQWPWPPQDGSFNTPTDNQYSGGSGASRYSQSSVTNTGYFNR